MTIEERFKSLVETRDKIAALGINTGKTIIHEKEFYFSGCLLMLNKFIDNLNDSKSMEEFNAGVKAIEKELDDFYQDEYAKDAFIDHSKLLPIENICPHCEANLNSITSDPERDDEPTCGDMTICLHCHNLLIFQLDMTLRPLTDDDEISQEALDALRNIKKAHE